ncbi:competence protein ComEC, partial [Caulobacter sp. D4A]
MLWAPVAFGLGAAGYLELKVEPSWSLLALVALALAVLAVWSRGWPRWSGLAIPLTLAAFAASGALAGKVRCDRVAAPVMP